MNVMKIVDGLAMLLVIVGALNWGLVGALDMNLVTMVLGVDTMLTKVTYIVVGLAGLYAAVVYMKKCTGCNK